MDKTQPCAEYLNSTDREYKTIMVQNLSASV